jgi:hypothetical protein
MKRLSYFSWPFLLATLFLLTACPKPEPEPEAIALPAELKAYTRFSVGTYWIYQDSASRQLDSVWVVSLTDDIKRRKDQGRVIDKYEMFSMKTQSNQGGPQRVYGVSRRCSGTRPGDANDNDNFPCWIVKRGLFLPNSTADEGDTDVFPYRLDWTRPAHGSTLAVMTPRLHPGPYAVGTATYRDVVEVRVAQDASEYGWKSHYYWAPNVGIVRHRRWLGYDVSTWTLVRSRIVQ